MKKTKKIIDSLDQFVDHLIVDKGLVDLDPEIREQVKSDLSERLDDRINALIVEKLPSEKLDGFNKILDSGSEREIQEFCRQNIFDLDQLIAVELMNFRQSYLG